MIVELNDVESFTAVFTNAAQTNTVSVVDFYTTWCGPCNRAAPFYIYLSEKYTNVQFFKVNCDVEAMKDVIEACKVRSLPTFCFFIGENYTESIVGANEEVLEAIVVKHIQLSQEHNLVDANNTEGNIQPQ